MTDKGWIMLAVVLFLLVFTLAMVALWRISVWLSKTNAKLQELCYSSRRIVMDIPAEIMNVYEQIFTNAEATIWRDDKEETKHDNT